MLEIMQLKISHGLESRFGLLRYLMKFLVLQNNDPVLNFDLISGCSLFDLMDFQ